MTVSPSAEPFVAEGDSGSPRGRIGVLLVHGFTGSTASMRPWAEYLAGQGYAVSAPRLPGHGTTWQEMNKTSWADWRGEVEQAYEALANRVDHVFVCGLSMGGALALRFAADHPHRPAGLVLVNAAVATDRKDVKLLPVLKHVIPSMPGIANDIKKSGVEEHGYTQDPAARRGLDVPGLQGAVWRPRTRHLPGAALPVHRRPRRRPVLGAHHPGHRSGPTTYARSCWRTATTWPPSTTTPSASSRGPLRSSSASPGQSPEADPHRDDTAGPRGRARRRRALGGAPGSPT